MTTTTSVPEINSTTQAHTQFQTYHPANLDLADKNGFVKNLREKRLDHTAYASELLEPRETYVLVYVQPSEIKNQVKIEPLLKNCELLTPSFIKNLQPKPSKGVPNTNTKQNKQSNTSNNTRNSVSNNSLLSKSEQKVLHDAYSKSQSQAHHQSSNAPSQTPTRQGKGSKERT